MTIEKASERELANLVADCNLTPEVETRIRGIMSWVRIEFKSNIAENERRDIAARIMAGFAASPHTVSDIRPAAALAVAWTDILLVELNK